MRNSISIKKIFSLNEMYTYYLRCTYAVFDKFDDIKFMF